MFWQKNGLVDPMKVPFTSGWYLAEKNWQLQQKNKKNSRHYNLYLRDVSYDSPSLREAEMAFWGLGH